MKKIKEIWNSDWQWKWVLPAYVVLFFVGFGIGSVLAALA